MPLSVSDFVRWSAANPAKIGGLYPRKGAIQPGSDADITIVDLAREWTIDDAKLQSRSKATPFHGMKAKGFPAHSAFPVIQADRHPRLHFRGLLGLHSRYGPLDRSTAQGGLCHEASARSVAQTSRSSATRSINNSLGGIFLHW